MDFLSAVSYASTEWGGFSHPIVPVGRSDRLPGLYEQIIADLEPEVWIDYSGRTPSERDQLTRALSRQVMEIPGVRREPGAHVLIAVPPEEVDHRRDLVVPPAASPFWHKVALGVVPEEHQDWWSDLNFSFKCPEMPSEVVRAQIEGNCVIGVTRAQIQVYEADATSDALVICCWRRPTLSQLLWFWNLRATAAPSLKRTTIILATPESLNDPSIGAVLREAAWTPFPRRPDLVLVGEDLDALRGFGEQCGFTLDRGRRIQSRIGPERDPITDPLRFMLNVHPAEFVLGSRREGTRVTVPVTVTTPSTTARFASPVRFNPRFGGYVRVDIDGIPDLQWPKNSGAAGLVLDNAEYSRQGLSILTTSSVDYRLDLRVPTATAVLARALGMHGWSWRLSDKGRYAQGLASSLSDRTQLDVLADRDVLAVAARLMTLSTTKATQAIARGMQGARHLATHEEVVAVARESIAALSPQWLTGNEIASRADRKLRPVVFALNKMIRIGLARRGLRHKCIRCGVVSHLPLPLAADVIACPGCRHEDVLGGAASDREPTIVYRLNSLLDRALDQDCASHIVVARWLERYRGVRYTVPGAEVVRGEELREIDILAVSGHEIVVGEVKASGTAFTQDVIRDITSLAKDLGADRLILASLDDIRDDARLFAERRAQRLALALDLIDASELLAG